MYFHFVIFLFNLLRQEMWNDIHWYGKNDRGVLFRWYRIQRLQVSKLHKKKIILNCVEAISVIVSCIICTVKMYNLQDYLESRWTFWDNFWSFFKGFWCFLFSLGRYHLKKRKFQAIRKNLHEMCENIYNTQNKIVLEISYLGPCFSSSFSLCSHCPLQLYR